MGSLGDMVVRILGDPSQLNNTLNSVQNRINGLGSALSGAFKIAGGMAIFNAIEEGLKNTVGLGWEFNKVMETNKIAFDTIIGSQEKSNKLMKDLANMAAETPFEFQDLTTASKKLLAFGFAAEGIPYVMKQIGDAAAGVGLGAEGIQRVTLALGQMIAKGKVQAGEMLQMTETGIPAWDILAQKMGKTTAEVMKMSEDGLIPAQKAVDMLLEGMGEKFPGMMDKMSKSFVGLMSTLKDNIQMTMGKILESAFEGAKKSLEGLISLTQRFSNVFQKSLEDQTKQQRNQVLASSPSSTGGQQQGPSVMQALGTATNDLVYNIGGQDAVQAWMQIQQAITNAINGIQQVIQAAMPSIQSIMQTFNENILPIFNSLWEYFVTSVLPAINEGMMFFATNIMPVLAEGFNWLCTTILPWAIDIFYSLWNTICIGAQQMYEFLAPMVQGVVTMFEYAWPYISELVHQAMDIITVLVDSLGAVLQGIGEFISGAFTMNWQRAWEGIKQIFGGIWDSIVAICAYSMNQVINTINGAIGGINAVFKTNFSLLKTIDVKTGGSKSVSQALSKGGGASYKKSSMPKYTPMSLKSEKTDYSKPKGGIFAKPANAGDLGKKGKAAKKKKSDAEKAAEKEAKDALKRQEQYMEDYIKKIYQAAKAIMDFGGMFDKVVTKKFSGEKFIKAMKTQLDVLKEWKTNITELGKKLGTKSSLYNALLQAGPQAAGEIKALNVMNPSKLKEYASLYKEKEKMAFGIAEQQTYSQGLQDTAQKNIQVNITGNTIKDDYDVDKIANQIVKKLKLAGVT